MVAGASLLYNFVNPLFTPLMVERLVFRSHPIHKRYFIPFQDLPRSTPAMVVTLEDDNFYRHWGFDWKMIREARERNRKAGRIKFGASTISNQLARTVFLTTHRNYFRKYLEAQVTVIMEICLSKERMLELYLNYVEWGKGIYGIESASRYYFGRSANRLSLQETMQLVAILTNPLDYTPHTYQRSPSALQRYQMLQRYH